MRAARYVLVGLLAGVLSFNTAFARPLRESPPAGGTFERAVRYENGESVSRDYRHARALYCEAAAQGDPRASLALAWMFMNGRGVARNDEAAAFWLHQAAAAHVPQAVTLLGVLGKIRPVERGCAEDRPSANSLQGQGMDGTAPPQGAVETREAIAQVAANAGIAPDLLSAMVSVESGYNSAAVSPKGAAGLMQLLPATAARFHVRNVFDYRENLRGGAAYVRILLDKFGGDLRLALAAYNAGEKAVDAHRGVPPYAETQAYVSSIIRLCHCENTGSILP